MTKLFSGLTRSELMSRIRSKGNKKTEIALILLMRRHGIKGWRRHMPLPGTPDFVFLKQRLAVFVDGCFWHGCPKHSGNPKVNRAFWTQKIITNKRRDKRVTRYLRSKGWSVVRIWEHDLSKRPEHCIKKIYRHLNESSVL